MLATLKLEWDFSMLINCCAFIDGIKFINLKWLDWLMFDFWMPCVARVFAELIFRFSLAMLSLKAGFDICFERVSEIWLTRSSVYPSNFYSSSTNQVLQLLLLLWFNKTVIDYSLLRRIPDSWPATLKFEELHIALILRAGAFTPP